MQIARLALCLLLVLSLPFAVYAQEEDDRVQAALEAAEVWVAQIDSADFDSSWESAAPVVRESVERDQWAAMLGQARSQTGDLSDRMLHASEYRTSLPNAPDGEYVVLQYDSSFENVDQANEVIVMMLTQDGDWRTAGYQVVPARQPDDVGRP